MAVSRRAAKSAFTGGMVAVCFMTVAVCVITVRSGNHWINEQEDSPDDLQIIALSRSGL